MYMNAFLAAAIVSYVAAVPVNVARDAEAEILRPGMHPERLGPGWVSEKTRVGVPKTKLAERDADADADAMVLLPGMHTIPMPHLPNGRPLAVSSRDADADAEAMRLLPGMHTIPMPHLPNGRPLAVSARDADAERLLPGMRPRPVPHLPNGRPLFISERDAAPEPQFAGIGTLFSDIAKAARPATKMTKPQAEHANTPSQPSSSAKPSGTPHLVAGGMEIATREEDEELSERDAAPEAQFAGIGTLFSDIAKAARPATKMTKPQAEHANTPSQPSSSAKPSGTPHLVAGGMEIATREEDEELLERDAAPEAQFAGIGTLFSDIAKAARPATKMTKPQAEHANTPSSTSSGSKPTGSPHAVVANIGIATRDEYEVEARDEYEVEARDEYEVEARDEYELETRDEYELEARDEASSANEHLAALVQNAAQ